MQDEKMICLRSPLLSRLEHHTQKKHTIKKKFFSRGTRGRTGANWEQILGVVLGVLLGVLPLRQRNERRKKSQISAELKLFLTPTPPK